MIERDYTAITKEGVLAQAKAEGLTLVEDAIRLDGRNLLIFDRNETTELDVVKQRLEALEKKMDTLSKQAGL